MEIKEARADFEERQKAIVKEMNENIAQRQQLEVRWKELVKESDMLNGENRMLERLSKDGNKAKS